MTTSGRVLLADDSPHAQRMGERILREEGYEVVTVTDGETAIIRLKDVEPDVVIVDAFLPQVSGYDLCGFIKKQPQHSHVRVLLTSTALEKVDEDHAFKVGADGQLKKPFEASVMLKSLKDLIGGSEKKKRSGTTLDLSYNPEVPAVEAESQLSKPEVADAAEEKPVSALQAWLAQHDAGAFNEAAQDEVVEATVEEEVPAPVTVGKAAAAVADDAPRLSNPQLLRRAEDEEEDLSLRNNPVAKLRMGAGASSPASRLGELEPKFDRGVEIGKQGGARGPRLQPVPSPAEGPESADDTPRPPRKSLLQQLEEFERASEAQEDSEAETTTQQSAAVQSEDASVSARTMEEVSGEAEVRREDEQQVSPSELDDQTIVDDEPAVSAGTSETQDEEDDFLLMRSRKGRSARPSLLETVQQAAEPEVEEEATEEPTPALVSEPEVEPVPEPVLSEVEAAVAEVPELVEQVAAISIRESGVRLDDEEVRAVVEIAVSAAMPAIVEEVSRCVMLALESRYDERAESNSVHRE